MAKLKVRWTQIALSDIENAFEFVLEKDKPLAAKKMIQKVLMGVDQCCLFPDSGRTGRVKGTRELIIATTPFIVVYRQKNDAIEILTILHQSRKWN